MKSLEQPSSQFLPDSTWRLWHALIAFAAGILGANVAALIAVVSGIDPQAPVAFSLIFAVQALSSFAVVLVLSRRLGTGLLAADVGFVVRGRDWWGVPAGKGLQIVISLATAPLIFRLFPDGPPEQVVAEIAAEAETFSQQLAVFAAVAVGAPLIEEIVFRGVLLAALARYFSKWPAILTSAAIFSTVHLIFDPNAIAVVPGLFLLGVALAWAAMRTGNLSLPIALHSGINLLAAISILYGSDLLEWSNDRLDQIEGVISLFF